MLKTAKSLFLSILFSPVLVLAEIGDIHTVRLDGAVVYEQADKSSPLVEKLSTGSEVMEMDVKGEWYEIYVASSDLSGWLHVSTLALLGSGSGGSVASAAVAAVTSGPAKLKVSASDQKTSGMKDFEKYLLKYNARTQALKGYTPFTGAESLEDGVLLVTVSDIWLEKSRARQKSSLITLHIKWKEAVDSGAPKVIAVDSNGNEVANYPQ